ncbi:DHHA1 domain-containing protein [Methanopyrus sp.]
MDPVEKVKNALVPHLKELKDERVAVISDIDVDGLASAAILGHVLKNVGADFVLYFSPPANFEEVVSGVAPECDVLIAADLGSTGKTAIQDAKSEGCRVIIVDHHQVLEDVRPDVFIHDTRLCAAELCYWATSDLHERDLRLIAAYAAFTDYAEEHSRVLRETLRMYDRRKVYTEASLLDYALIRMDGEDRRELALKLPETPVSELDEVYELARDAMAEEHEVLRRAREVAECLNEVVAYAIMDDVHPAMTGRVASHVAGVKRRPVGVCVRRGKISARVVEGEGIDVARAIRKAATEVGGKGGGHAPAAGGVVPESKVEEFLKLFGEEVKRQVESARTKKS